MRKSQTRQICAFIRRLRNATAHKSKVNRANKAPFCNPSLNKQANKELLHCRRFALRFVCELQFGAILLCAATSALQFCSCALRNSRDFRKLQQTPNKANCERLKPRLASGSRNLDLVGLFVCLSDFRFEFR